MKTAQILKLPLSNYFSNLMKAMLLLVVVLFVTGLNIQGKAPENQPISDTLTNHAYHAGEFLKYKVYYGWLNGGTALLSLTEKQYNGKTVHHAKAYAKTTGMADNLFKVRDIYESYMEPVNGLSIKSIRNIKEGKYTDYNEVIYDQKGSKVTSTKSGVKKVPSSMRDIIAAFYYLRRVNFDKMKKDQTVLINTYFEDNLYPLNLKYKGKENIKTSLGTIKCVKLVPIVITGGVFDDAEKDLTIWISDDKNHIPVRIEVDFIVGSFKIDLIAHTGLRNTLAVVK
ncbi:MAG: DUF3108 domain-containing protein [Bacteroidales bacterium]|nr:DUF3108 domain-containing protein [Bacteroidales bacterium]